MITLLVLIGACLAGAAAAHRANESYVYFTVTDERLSGRVEATLADIGRVLDLDADGDGILTRAELEAEAEAAFAFFAQRLQIYANGARAEMAPGGIGFLDDKHGTFAQLRFSLPGVSPVPSAIDIAYRPLTDAQNPRHLGFALIESNSRTGIEGNESRISLIFEPGAALQTLSLVGDAPLEVAADYLGHGVRHVWQGFDHLLFLAALMVPAVLVHRDGAWRAVPDLPTAYGAALLPVGAMVLAQTGALALAAFGLLSVPAGWAESVISLAIALVGLGLYLPALRPLAGGLAVLAGAAHGLGYGGVLDPLGTGAVARGAGVSGFGAGLALAMMAIVLAGLPVLFAVRAWPLYRAVAVRAAPLGFAVLAGVWFVERSSGILWRVQQQLLAALS